MLDTERFGKKLKALRMEKGYSQRQMADLMKVSNATIANWEVGKRLPDIHMLSRLARCLNVESYVLLDELHGPNEPPRIIVVEDVQIILNGLMHTLCETLPEAQVRGFRKGDEALEYANANRVAVAFLDIELAGENGIQIAKRLLAIEAHTNIIFLTCHTEYAREALDLYCSGYILKPLTPEKLRREIANLRYPVRGLRT